MREKKRLGSYRNVFKFSLILFSAIYFLVFYSPYRVEASERLTSGKFNMFPGDGYWENDDSFELDKTGVVYFTFDVKLDNESTSNGKQGIQYRIRRYEYNEELYDEDYGWDTDFMDCTKSYVYTALIPKGERECRAFFWPDETLNPGYYTLEIKPIGSKYDYVVCKYCVEYFPGFASDIKIPSVLNIKTDKYSKLKISNITPTGSLNGAVFKSSNKKIADVYYDGTDEAYVYAYKAGKCNIIATLENGRKYICKVKVTDPPAKLQYKKYTMCKGDKLQNKLLYNKKKVVWSSSNNNIATVSSNGKIVAKEVGKCTITAKVKNKKYNCIINVVRQNPNFFAAVSQYNTRNNYFNVRIRNRSNKPLKIISGMRVEHVAYTAYDRTVSLPNVVTIKPNSSANVRFYVNGGLTWYDHTRYTLYYKFMFDDVIYEGHVWDKNSVFGYGSKWYHTYFDDEMYQSWL